MSAQAGEIGASQAISARQLAEEIANSVTHGVGLLLSVVGFIVLVVLAAMQGSTLHVVSCGIYGATLVGLYAASTVYHACREPRRKALCRRIDHCAIYLLIAGTYTPFALVNLRGGWGWTLLALAWGMAAVGILAKLFVDLDRFIYLDAVLYLLMGWMAVLAIRPILAHVPPAGITWMVAGGLLYTAGVWFYLRDHNRYWHAIWHLFVLGGSACHYFAVLTSVLPNGA